MLLRLVRWRSLVLYRVFRERSRCQLVRPVLALTRFLPHSTDGGDRTVAALSIRSARLDNKYIPLALISAGIHCSRAVLPPQALDTRALVSAPAHNPASTVYPTWIQRLAGNTPPPP